MDLKTILRRLPPQDGGLTVAYGGETFPMPYETLTVGKETIPGVRENAERFRLLDICLAGVQPKHSLLDIGCNMGTTAARFSQTFDHVVGIEAQAVYHGIARDLYPHAHFIHADLNRSPLRDVTGGRVFSVVLALSMIEYIQDKRTFVEDLYQATEQVCVVEGHSEDIYPRQRHLQYEALLKSQPWTVERLPVNTDPGLNAPKWSQGRPVWVCRK
jgi:SAM-dependent methyltransferase